jgi:hypothetical protein
LGAPRPAWPPKSLMKRGLPGFLGRYLVTVLRSKMSLEKSANRE